ncbi:MAG: branched-chain amino acid transport system ATP-binding protein [Thermodesulfobacteriota bacterium]|nr:branched-chain amino acid transport system ATP-binding protein [Thermodesulfobacteriota bacterium]
MLKVNNIQVVYNKVIMVLKGISLEVPEGKVIALLGANAAGKTTTLKTICGIVRFQNGELEGGEIEFNGHVIDRKDPDEIVRMGICMVPEGRRVFDDLNVLENLHIGAHTRRDREGIKRDLDLVMEYFPQLRVRSRQRAILLSGGEQQMLAIGRALMSRPRLLMLDEPSLGLAPMLVNEIFTILARINREQNTSILLVEQNARAALNFSQYGYIMENGKIVLDGPSDQLQENDDVKEFYLGVTDDSGKKSYAGVKHYKRRKRWLS